MPWIIGGAAVLGGAIGMMGQQGANSTNMRIARQQMNWQERMSNTAYQRSTRDLIAAGLNPMLAVRGAGASTPSPPPVNVENATGPLAQGISQGAMNSIAAKQASANIVVSAAQARKTNAEAAVLEAGLPHSAQNAQNQASLLASQAEKMGYEARSALNNVYVSKGDVILKDLDIAQKNKLNDLVIQYQQLLNRAAELKIPEAKATADFFKNVPEAKWMLILKQFLSR